MTTKHSGKCACGAITYEFDAEPGFVAVCHCLDCKRASGGEAATFLGVPENGFAVLSGKPKPFKYVADSGKSLNRNFCPDCGSRLFTSQLESFPETVFVMIGSMDNSTGIKPAVEMFTKRRLDWTPALPLPQYEAMPG